MKKSVKSVLCFILVMGMISMLAACSGDVAGHYELVSVVLDGTTQNAAGLGYIDLHEDGTGYMNIRGTEFEMCWADGQIWPASDPNDKVFFSVEGNTLTLDMGGSTAIFKK